MNWMIEVEFLKMIKCETFNWNKYLTNWLTSDTEHHHPYHLCTIILFKTIWGSEAMFLILFNSETSWMLNLS